MMFETARRGSRWQALRLLAAVAVMVCLQARSIHAQSIFTVAGGGFRDEVPATLVDIEPRFVAFDSSGNLYFSDLANNRIRRVDASTGIITTIAGNGVFGFSGDGGPATEASLDPSGVTLDRAGNVYVATGERIRRIDNSTGVITTVAGSFNDISGDGGPATEARLRGPSGLAFDETGNLYIVERGDSRIRRVDGSTGIITTIAGNGEFGFSGDGGAATEASLNNPSDVAIDAAGNIYIADASNNRIRRVDASTGIITTIAGSGELGFPRGDGGPATEAALYTPEGVALDASGNLYIAEWEPRRVRRVDASTGVITTVAGSSRYGFGGDGGSATEASLSMPSSVALDPAGDLYIADTGNRRVRRVNGSTGIITTIAGNGGFSGDEGPAVEASLLRPSDVALDDSGNLYIADGGNNRIRGVDLSTGIITTIAGNGEEGFSGDDGSATEASLNEPRGLALDGFGNLYIADTGNRLVRRVNGATGIITTVAGNAEFEFGGDGGPATEATLGAPYGVAIDGLGNLYIADYEHSRIRRVDSSTGIITTVAGNGSFGFSGDGGSATEASLNRPSDVAVDASGNLYIADSFNLRVRRVDALTGIITTVAGNGECCFGGTGGPATDAQLSDTSGLAFDEMGNLYIADLYRVLRVDSATGIIATIVGPSSSAYGGDGGPAITAGITPRKVTVDRLGNLYIADEWNHRIRVVSACVDVDPPVLLAPDAEATGLTGTPALSWSESDGGFAYDVRLDAASPPARTVVSGLSGTTFSPQNLTPGVTYFWQVVAKGDPYCVPFSSAESEIRSFTITAGCGPPSAFELAEPTDASTISGESVELAWLPASGAESYDVFLGTAHPPPLLRSTSSTSLTVSGLVPGTTYHWTVVSRAGCDATLTTPASRTRTFTVTGVCEPAGSFELRFPADGSSDTSRRTRLDWTDSANASSYDLFFGTTSPPPLFLRGIRGTELGIAGLTSSTSYSWQVRANVECDPTGSFASPVVTFTTRDDCPPPEASGILFTPPGGVTVGETYAITWSEATGLDAGGTYVVERSRDPAFSSILDSQEVSTTSATFIAETAGAHYHRVRPVMRCDRAVTGPDSAAAEVDVVAEESNVIFTVEPDAVILGTGKRIENRKANFTLENLSDEPVDVSITEGRIDSVPFFFVRDPLGGSCCFGVTLDSREPRRFEIQFSGPPNDVPASYQGFVVVNTLGKVQPVIPYAFVNLKVGDQGNATPEFRVSGHPTEYASFPGFRGDDASRPPIAVEIHNPGSEPMELGSEIGPELWLEPKPGWNETPIPPGASRTVELFTRRTRALADSALPRYSYFTVRTKAGESARLLVQDNAANSGGEGRTAALDPGVRSFVIPEVVSETSGDGVTLISKVRLTNVGGQPVQAELVVTPSGADGFSSSVRRATVLVPPNDVVTLTDPLVQLFGLSRPVYGQLETRAAEEKRGLLRVQASIVDGDRADAALVGVPVLARSDGARQGLSHEIAGISRGGALSTCLILAETSGTDQTDVAVTLFDDGGTTIGQTAVTLPRYGYTRIDDVVAVLGGTTLSAGRIDLTVTEGGGSVIGIAKIEHESGRATALVSRAVQTGAAKTAGPLDEVTTTLVAPYVVSGDVDDNGVVYSTVLGLKAPFFSTVDFTITFDNGSQSLTETVTLPGAAIVEFADVIAELFKVEGPAEGSIAVEVPTGALAYSRLTTNGLPAGAIDLIPSASELTTNLSSAKPLYVEGLEQSTDPTRGARWNLHVREIAGEAGAFTVRLYEAGNRSHPIAVKEFGIESTGEVHLKTIFDEMDLNNRDRRKDRTNVLCVLTPKSGGANLVAVAVEIDNVTGTATPHTLGPASGLSSEVSRALVRVIELGDTSRRRPVRRVGGD